MELKVRSIDKSSKVIFSNRSRWDFWSGVSVGAAIMATVLVIVYRQIHPLPDDTFLDELDSSKIQSDTGSFCKRNTPENQS